MLRIVYVNPLGCGLELSRKHGCRHVWREPTAEIFSNSWFSTKEMSRTIQRKRLGTLSFIPQSDLQISVEVFRNGVKMYSRSLEPDDVSAVGSVWASSAGEQQMPIFLFSFCLHPAKHLFGRAHLLIAHMLTAWGRVEMFLPWQHTEILPGHLRLCSGRFIASHITGPPFPLWAWMGFKSLNCCCYN